MYNLNKKTISEIALSYAGGTPSRSNREYYGGDIPWVKSGEINSVDIYTTEEKITKEALNNSSAKIVEKGAILVAMYGATAGKVGRLHIEAATNQAVLSLRVKDPSVCSNDYLFWALSFASDDLIKQCQGAAQPNLSKLLIDSYSISCPPLLAQNKIVEILSTINERIELLTKKTQEIIKLKTYLIQNLFSKGIGTWNENGNWQHHSNNKNSKIGIIPMSWGVCQLGQVVSIKSKKYDPKNSPKDYLCIELEHISQGNGKILGSTSSVALSSIKNHFNPGDILFGKLRPYLKKFAFPEFDGVCSTEIWVMSIINNKIAIPKFIYYFVQHESFLNEANKSCGTKMPRADWKVVSELEIPIPPLAEQEEIANILSTVDEKLDLLEQQKYETELLKEGLMQKLLTGEWQVPLDNTEEKAA